MGRSPTRYAAPVSLRCVSCCTVAPGLDAASDDAVIESRPTFICRLNSVACRMSEGTDFVISSVMSASSEGAPLRTIRYSAVP